ISSASRDIALRHIASAQAAIGNLQKAIDLLDSVSNDSEKMSVLMRTAEAQAQAGDTGSAMTTAQSISELRYRAVVLSSIGLEQALSGQITEAMDTLDAATQAKEGIQYPFARDYASSRIAIVYGKISISKTPEYNVSDDTNSFDPEIFKIATSSVDDIQDQQLRAKTYFVLAFNRLDAGNKLAWETKDRAIAAIGDIESISSQAWLLADLAEGRAKAGNEEWAREFYNLSLDIARNITNSWGRARVLAKLSQALMALAEISSIEPKTQ
ncbi:MAG: hypothetical protein HON65_11365, partial [Rhodospirillales bacterium]|nr:hypothetical protein [Rhodospirillales bacterium]